MTYIPECPECGRMMSIVTCSPTRWECYCAECNTSAIFNFQVYNKPSSITWRNRDKPNEEIHERVIDPVVTFADVNRTANLIFAECQKLAAMLGETFPKEEKDGEQRKV